jgi:hypothetical protein
METLFTFDTVQTACCVEWSPHGERNQVICGTYFLENQSSRIGTLFSFKNEELKKI